MAAEQIPGMVVAAAIGDHPAAYLVVGQDAVARPLAPDALFPVASVTKLATALAVLHLVDAGAIELDALLARYAPDARAAQNSVTIRALLSHSAGLPLDLPNGAAPYAPDLDWPKLAQVCLQTPLDHSPRTRVQYGNVGYGLLAIIVERVTGQPFAAALDALVLTPLGIEAYLGSETPRPPAALAGVRSNHAGTSLEPFNSAFWRSLMLPWAGITTTAAGALALVRAFGGRPDDFLHPATRAEAIRDQAGGLEGGFLPPLDWDHCPWGLGPELRGDKRPHWTPPQSSPASFGHVGASGSLAWFDPPTGAAWAILGARTNASGWMQRGGTAIGAAVLHECAG